MKKDNILFAMAAAFAALGVVLRVASIIPR